MGWNHLSIQMQFAFVPVEAPLMSSSLFASYRWSTLSLLNSGSILPSLTARKPWIMCQEKSRGGHWGAWVWRNGLCVSSTACAAMPGVVCRWMVNTVRSLAWELVCIMAVARVRGDPPLLQSAMDILWRLRFSRLRQAPSRKAWYSRGPVKSKIIASYVHENFYLWYFILPQIMVFPCSINITARLACTNNHTCSTDSLARLIIGFKSTK